MVRLVSDQVWARLDPGVGRLTRRTARRLTLVFAVLVVVLAASAVLWRSGLVTARLSWDQYVGGFAYSVEARRVEHAVKVHNDGWIAVTVLGGGRDMPGMTLVAVSPAVPLVLAPGETRDFIVTYQVDDCAAVSREAWPVPIRVEHWWGEQTAYIEVPKQLRGAPDGMIYDSGPYEVEWQYELGAIACGVR